MCIIALGFSQHMRLYYKCAKYLLQECGTQNWWHLDRDIVVYYYTSAQKAHHVQGL